MVELLYARPGGGVPVAREDLGQARVVRGDSGVALREQAGLMVDEWPREQLLLPHSVKLPQVEGHAEKRLAIGDLQRAVQGGMRVSESEPEQLIAGMEQWWWCGGGNHGSRGAQSGIWYVEIGSVGCRCTSRSGK